MADKFPPFSLETSTNDLERVDMLQLKKTQSIIFDTNFLFVCFKQGVDVIREIERIFGKRPPLYIIEGTIRELNGLVDRKDKDKKFLPLIVKFLHTYNFKILASKDTYVDRELLRVIDENTVVATNDRELKKKVKEKHSKLLYMRQEEYLVLE